MTRLLCHCQIAARMLAVVWQWQSEVTLYIGNRGWQGLDRKNR